jgi:hypothetical protein
MEMFEVNGHLFYIVTKTDKNVEKILHEMYFSTNAVRSVLLTSRRPSTARA